MSLDSRVAVIHEAMRLGMDQEARHEVSKRYIDAMLEFIRINPPVSTLHPSYLDYRAKMRSHAAEKARGYIRRHAPDYDPGRPAA